MDYDPFDSQLFPNMGLHMQSCGNQKWPCPEFLTNTLLKSTICTLNQSGKSVILSYPQYKLHLCFLNTCVREECHHTSLASESGAVHPAHLSVTEAPSAQASCIPPPLQNGKEVLGGIPYFQWFSDGCFASEEFRNTVFSSVEQNDSEIDSHCSVTKV